MERDTRARPVSTAPRSMAVAAYEQIRDAIASLALQPGEGVSEGALAEQLGLGRTPVREALSRLRGEGLVDVIPRKGYIVSRITPEDAAEIYELLEGLESMAVRLAAERATQADLQELELAVAEQERALEEDDLDAWVAADELFHDTVITVAGNDRIRRVIEPLNAQLHRLRLFTIRLRPKPTRSTEEHREELEAMKLRDAELARQIHQRHRAHAREVMVGVIRKYAGPRGGL